MKFRNILLSKNNAFILSITQLQASVVMASQIGLQMLINLGPLHTRLKSNVWDRPESRAMLFQCFLVDHNNNRRNVKLLIASIFSSWQIMDRIRYICRMIKKLTCIRALLDFEQDMVYLSALCETYFS
jgi:hypothetical protein